MRQSDILRNATRALRKAERNAENVSGTRTRVLDTVEHKQRQRSVGIVASIAILMTLGGSTAWATAEGYLPEVANRILEIVGITETAENEDDYQNTPRRESQTTRVEPRSARLNHPDTSIPEPSPEEEITTTEETTPQLIAQGSSTERLSNSRPGNHSVPRRSVRTNARLVTQREAAPQNEQSQSQSATTETASTRDQESDLPRDPDTLYLRAHEIHFTNRNYGLALIAWNRYLRLAPSGRFALEARYNRAIALARLGRSREAVSALRPFADGIHRGYRQREATQLIEALQNPTRRD